jgi:hypothetical protein
MRILCEPLYYIIFVLPDTGLNVARYPDIEGAISFAGQDVDRWLSARHQHAGFPLARE